MTRRRVIHAGNGTVYLLSDEQTDYINVDLDNGGCGLAKDFPKAVERWGTTADNYYGKFPTIEEHFLDKLPMPNELTRITDVYGSWTALPFPDAFADELWAVQVFEHLSHAESKLALAETRRVLRPGGLLHLDIPDHVATLGAGYEAYASGDKVRADFMMRHLLGSKKKDWAYHTGSWDRESLIAFCELFGFRHIGDNPDIHIAPSGRQIYPALALRFERMKTSNYPELDEHVIQWKAAYEYAGENGAALEFPGDGGSVLEVGPGNAPWPRSDVFVDIVERDVKPRKFIRADVQSLPFENKQFAYCLVSHVLEHVEDPVKAASELSRVAKRGCIVCPSPFKEGLFAAHEQDHKWWIFESDDVLYFKRIPEGLYPSIYNADVSGQTHRMLHYGDPRLGELSLVARKWFKEIEPRIDVIHHFKSPLQVRILE